MPQLLTSKPICSQLYQHKVIPFTFWRVALICGCVAPVFVTCGVLTVHVWMLCVPWGSLWSLYVCCIGCWSARFAPFKLLRMRKKVGISPMSFEQCIIVTSDTNKWPRKISWELSPVITWQCRERYLCLRGFSPGVPHWSNGLTRGLHLPQWQVKSSSRNCLKHDFW